MNKVKKGLLIIAKLVMCAAWITQSKEMDDQGAWGYWINKSQCSSCLRIRYRYNCTEEDPRTSKSTWDAEGLCDAGVYYERINRNLKGCFFEDPRIAENLDNTSELDGFDMNVMEDYLKSKGLWNEGRTLWTRCSRRAGRRKGSIYNRRGRKARVYYCPTNGKKIWKEQWSYCCAGVWSRWQRITECPECGGGTTKFVRICGIPGVPLDVKELSLDGEFMSEWKEENCKNSHCARVEEKLKTCERLCREGVWEDDTKCLIDDDVLQASQCCMSGYRGLHPSCGSIWERTHNPSEYRHKITMVATILGAEALLIVVTAVIVILYNIGKVPNIFAKMISTCCCHKQKKAPPSLATASKWQDITKYQMTKGKKVKEILLENKGNPKYLEESQPAIPHTDDDVKSL